MKNSYINEQLIAKIEKLRKEMISVGLKNGLECPQVISISQKLDSLIFEYQKQLNSLDSDFQKLA